MLIFAALYVMVLWDRPKRRTDMGGKVKLGNSTLNISRIVGKLAGRQRSSDHGAQGKSRW